ncbi:MAG: DNA replication and repair protein RecF [Coraliomargarita sp. TMED73]|nr:MAG: DNA replication and repair protein RecF [Coraliomargarita sp. TMED73]|tara:strand:- start:724 stop:1791 length:1068 start_codon:yes stop_codon:yes gene_type:complete
MRFSNIRLQDFRNVGFAELELNSLRVFLLGSNGQGKSNLLEALGLVTAVRSFRTQDLSALLRKGGAEYTAVYLIKDEREGEVELEIVGGGRSRKIRIDGEVVDRLGDFIGRFPVVPLSSGDLQILRGSPAERRRFLDITLSAVDRSYYDALRRYHRGVAERNRLLKRGGSVAELSAFEAEMAPAAASICEGRTAAIEKIGPTLRRIYETLAEGDEGPELFFKANVTDSDAEAFRLRWEEGREQDGILGATRQGPHRDDFELRLTVGGAREYGSDGQQRALCVALRLAQAQYFQEMLGHAPVLLADDVLGELDPRRRAGFWKSCPQDWQIIASGTARPEGEGDWAVWQVQEGHFHA